MGHERGCFSTIFTTYNVTYNKICGQVRGYQKGVTVAFWGTTESAKSINGHYVAGIPITLGNPRKHVWTYAAGASDDGNFDASIFNCPCAAIPGPADSPAFVGNHYYCESGSTGGLNYNAIFTSDALWDGNGCHHDNNNCCTNPDMPWFFRQFASSMHDYLEARICRGHPTSGQEDTLVESIELYVQ